MTKEYDLMFSIGPACRPAYYLELSKIRTCAYPFDWLGINLDTIIKLFKDDFTSFFNKYHEEKDLIDKSYRTVVDDNNIISAHHIPLDIPLDEGVKNFKNLMLKRFTRLKNDIDHAKNICMLTNQETKENNIISFLKEFQSIYPNKKITLINIRNNRVDYFKETNINNNLTFIEFGFNDINKLGNNPKTNPMFWIGNEEKWLKVTTYLKERKIENE